MVSNQIKIKRNSSEVISQKNRRNEGPDFIWIIRDSSLKFGINKQDYLRKFFKFEKSRNEKLSEKQQNELKQKIEVKVNLTESFKSIDCSILRIPVIDDTVYGKTAEQALQSIDKLKLKQLRKEYQDDLNDLFDQINFLLKPMEINNQNLNGLLLAEYLKKIVNFINEEKTIYLHDTISMTLKEIAEHCLEKYVKKFVTELMNYFTSSEEPLKTIEFSRIKNEALQKCLKQFKENFPNNPILYKEYKEKFDILISEKKKSFNKINHKRIYQKDFQTVIDLFKHKFIDNVIIEDKYNNVDDFMKDVDKLKNEFESFDHANGHLNDTFWTNLFDDDNVRLFNLKEKIIKKEQERKMVALALKFSRMPDRGFTRSYNHLTEESDSFDYIPEDLDMRFKVNRDEYLPPRTNLDGSKDRRFRENKDY